MKTLQQWTGEGYERVMSRGQRRDLVQGRQHRIILTNGVDGSGLQTGCVAVVLLGRDEVYGGWTRIESRPVAVVEDFVSDVLRRGGDGPGILSFARTAEINAAAAEMRALVGEWA